MVKWRSLRERSYGVLERRSNSELKEAAAAAGVDVIRYTPDGGETLDQMFARVKVPTHKYFLSNGNMLLNCNLGQSHQAATFISSQGFFEEFVAFLASMSKDEATVLVVSHGGTIASILRYLAAEQGENQSYLVCPT